MAASCNSVLANLCVKPRAGRQHRPSADNRIQAGFYNSVLVWVICFYGKIQFILSETFFF